MKAEECYQRWLAEAEKLKEQKAKVNAFIHYYEETYGFKKGENDGSKKENETPER